MFRIIACSLALAVMTFASVAEARQGDWTPRDVEPECLVPQAYMDSRTAGAIRPYVTPEIVILKWHLYGAETPQRLSGKERHHFEVECLSKAADERCGVAYDKKVARLTRIKTKIADRRKAWKPGGRFHAIFADPPRDAALDFAQRGLGQCFGSDRELTSGPPMDRVSLSAPMEYCEVAAHDLLARNRNQWFGDREVIDPELQPLRGWAMSMANITRKFRDPRNAEICTSAPASVARTIQRRMEQDGAEAAAERKEAERLANRTVEERIAGLNGCQIAYSLVFNGLNAGSGQAPVGTIPDDALRWALEYERANLNGNQCPVMPVDLSDWVEKQPLDRFEAVEDPYVDFRKRTEPYSRTPFGWQSFTSIWMSRYQTQNVISGNDVSVCQKVRHLMQSQRSSASPLDSAERAFWQLFGIVGDDPYGVSYACHVTPPHLVAQAERKWQADIQRMERTQERMDERERALAELQRRLNPPEPLVKNYLWRSPPTTRCYWAGDTKYGYKQACFTN